MPSRLMWRSTLTYDTTPNIRPPKKEEGARGYTENCLSKCVSNAIFFSFVSQKQVLNGDGGIVLLLQKA